MMTLQQVAQWTNGKLIGSDAEVTAVNTDTRTLTAGQLFVALKGEQFDGHKFLAQAKAAGAQAAVVSQPQDTFTQGVMVQDTRNALGQLAAGWGNQCGTRHLAVTGNSGKTTVKEMLAHLLSEHDCLATEGNFNNEIGVPLTLLRLAKHHDYGVFELGANHKGEIAWTASLVAPEVAVITNVTGAHLEGFGSLEGIAAAKAEIIPAVQDNGIVVLNKEGGFYDTFAEHAKNNGVNTVVVSIADASADFVAKDIQCKPESVDFVCHNQGEDYAIHLPVPAKHQVANALQAIAAARHLGVAWPTIQQKLSQLPSVSGRLQRQACLGGWVIDDTYNANPGSVAAAIQYLASQPGPQTLVFAGMGELGAASEAEHIKVGELARQQQIDNLVLVGELAQPAAQGYGANTVQCAHAEEAVPHALSVLQQGGSVLVKGSRSTKMEAVVNALLAQQKEAN